ncbi:MAG: hypothetical protein H6822_28505 [Planctomycetaceae bacterium]|nr:hypothetical protein [Planctomycetaceae bacterium]
MQAFSSSLVDQADQRLVEYAKQRFPNEFQNIGDPTLLEFVKRVRATAGLYGIEKENDVATFLDFSVMYGENFPQAPWADDILTCDALHGPDKMAVLRFRVRETGVNL